MTEEVNDKGAAVDLLEAQQQAESDVVAQREESLAKTLAEMRTRKRKLVDPLQYAMSIQDPGLTSYVPAFGWETESPSAKQKAQLEKYGIFPDEIKTAGEAQRILDRMAERRSDGLTTPKQIRFLESKGFLHVGTWGFESAKAMIDRIAANGWHIPKGIVPREYVPPAAEPQFSDFSVW